MISSTVRETLAIAGMFGFTVAAPQGAEPAEDLTVVVHIMNYAQVPARELRHAQEHVERVFRAIDVEIVWLEAFVRPALGIDPVTLLLLPPRMVANKAAAERISEHVLGSSGPGTRRAWAFYDRIVTVATAAGLDPAVALGRVLAHEIGHLLAPQLGHQEGGPMRPTLDTANASVQRFTDAQGRAVRATLRAWRLAATAAPVDGARAAVPIASRRR